METWTVPMAPSNYLSDTQLQPSFQPLYTTWNAINSNIYGLPTQTPCMCQPIYLPCKYGTTSMPQAYQPITVASQSALSNPTVFYTTNMLGISDTCLPFQTHYGAQNSSAPSHSSELSSKSAQGQQISTDISTQNSSANIAPCVKDKFNETTSNKSINNPDEAGSKLISTELSYNSKSLIESNKKVVNYFNNILYKTELCRDYMMRNECPRTEDCQFAHGNEDIRKPENHFLYRTEICPDIYQQCLAPNVLGISLQSKKCSRGPKCYYAHSVTELRKVQH